MTPGDPGPSAALLDAEVRAWRDLPALEYDAAVRSLVEHLASPPASPVEVEALLELAGATLRRQADGLTDSRGAVAERLLVAAAAVPDATVQLRAGPLVAAAWSQLTAAAERGPASVPSTPDLPRGVQLPYGADPADIADPELREQALRAAGRHEEHVRRWTATQRALGHLRGLTALVLTVRPRLPDPAAADDLLVLLSSAPGLPDELRSALRDAVR